MPWRAIGHAESTTSTGSSTKFRRTLSCSPSFASTISARASRSAHAAEAARHRLPPQRSVFSIAAVLAGVARARGRGDQARAQRMYRRAALGPGGLIGGELAQRLTAEGQLLGLLLHRLLLGPGGH